MSTLSNLGLCRLIEYDKRNSPLLSLLNAPTVSDTTSKAQANKPVLVQADFLNNSDNNNNNNNYNRLNFKRVLYLKQR
jgi:hypothetical protein